MSSLLPTNRSTIPETSAYVISSLPTLSVDSTRCSSPPPDLLREAHSVGSIQCSRTPHLCSEHPAPAGLSGGDPLNSGDSLISYLSDEALTLSESCVPVDHFFANVDSHLPMTLMDNSEVASFMLLRSSTAEHRLSTPSFYPPVSFVLEPEDGFSFVELESNCDPRVEDPAIHTYHQNCQHTIQNFSSELVPTHSAPAEFSAIADDAHREYFPSCSHLLDNQLLDPCSFDTIRGDKPFSYCTQSAFKSELPSSSYGQDVSQTNFFSCSTEDTVNNATADLNVAGKIEHKAYFSFPNDLLVHGNICDSTVYYAHQEPFKQSHYGPSPALAGDHYQQNYPNFPVDSRYVPICDTQPPFHCNSDDTALAPHSSTAFHRDYDVDGYPVSSYYATYVHHAPLSHPANLSLGTVSCPTALDPFYAYPHSSCGTIRVFDASSTVYWPSISIASSNHLSDTQPCRFDVVQPYPLSNNPLNGAVFDQHEITQPSSLPATSHCPEVDCSGLPPCAYTPTSVRATSNVSPISCPHCSRLFNRPSHLDTHIRIHTGERPHECCLCGRNFNQASNLRRHLSSHKTWPPVPAKSRFTAGTVQVVSGDVLALHKRTYCRSKSWCCRYCNQQLSSYLQLRQHMVYHKDSRVYACVFELCLNTFDSPDALLSHLLDAHPIGYKSDQPCQHCGRTFSDVRQYIQHWLPRRRGLPPRCGPTSGNGERNAYARTQRPAYKTVSSKVSHFLRRRIRLLSLCNLRKDRSTCSFSCPICTLRLRTVARFRHHLVRSHGQFLASAAECSPEVPAPASLRFDAVLSATPKFAGCSGSDSTLAAGTNQSIPKAALFLLHVEEKEEMEHPVATTGMPNGRPSPHSDPNFRVPLFMFCELCGKRFQKVKFFDDHRQLCLQRAQEKLRRSRLRNHLRVGFKMPVDSSTRPPQPDPVEHTCLSQTKEGETDGPRRSLRKRTVIKTWRARRRRSTNSKILVSSPVNHTDD